MHCRRARRRPQASALTPERADSASRRTFSRGRPPGPTSRKARSMHRVAALFVRVFEYAVPDPYVFAVALTLLTAALALFLAPHHGAVDILGAWYKGIFDILAFA